MGRPTSPDGATRLAPNGYHYTKKDGEWRLTHHILAEENIGEPLDTKKYMARFRNGDRTDLRPSNIVVSLKKGVSVPKKLAILYAKRDDILAEIAELENELARDGDS